ncbi:MAG: prepilin-type N-terminal cleavage/methylation domain-containing protein [Patescibacteria group bacterium]
MIHSNKQAGFTLVEYLIYIAISATLLLVATNVLFTVLQGKEKLQAIEDVGQNGRYALAAMTQAISNAQSVTAPAYGASSTTLTMQTSSTSTTPTSFFVANGTVNIKEGSSPTTSLMADEVTVRTLRFTNVSGTATSTAIRIEMYVSSTNPEEDPDLAFDEIFRATATVRK